MGMKKREKKVLGAVGQDMSGSVLDKAKAEMGKSEKRVKKVRVAALASVCAVIIAVLVCLPVLLPHHAQEPQFVPNKNLSEIIIGREDLNEEIMFFDTKPQDSALYEYNGKKVFYVEHCNIEGVSVDFIVKFAEGNGDYIFETEEDIWDNAPEELKTEELSGREMTFGIGDNTFIRFIDGGCEYFVTIEGNYPDWREFLQKYLF